MRHYEVVFMVHPDQSENVPAMIDRYRSMIEGGGGIIHRQEDWGRRQLAFPVHNVHKAHYVLMNVECDAQIRSELESAFKFNDAVLRNLIIKRDKPVVDPSPLMKEAEAKAEADERERRARQAAAEESRSRRESRENKESGENKDDGESKEDAGGDAPENKASDENKGGDD